MMLKLKQFLMVVMMAIICLWQKKKNEINNNMKICSKKQQQNKSVFKQINKIKLWKQNYIMQKCH